MELRLVEVERARDDIRRGMPIILTKDDQKILLFSAEDFSQEHILILKKLNITTFDLILSPNRSKYLSFEENHFKLPFKANNKNIIEIIHSLIGLSQPDNIESLKSFEPKSASLLEEHGITFIKFTELIPAIITAELEPSTTEEYITKTLGISLLSISSEMVEDYYHNSFTVMKHVCTAPLMLKNAPHASISGYRPNIGGSEHYAIIVGTPLNDKAPLVRLHSSCFAGDLLASLRTDCGDQLQEAISFMNSLYQDTENSDFSGGIILYIMQEGRGIGLTNKFRAYDIQGKGNDTVDANRILGFNDDERQFRQAAAILKELSTTNICLLTNNPRKSRILEELDITVEDTLSHEVDLNEHNKEYLQTKKERLSHNL